MSHVGHIPPPEYMRQYSTFLVFLLNSIGAMRSPRIILTCVARSRKSLFHESFNTLSRKRVSTWSIAVRTQISSLISGIISFFLTDNQISAASDSDGDWYSVPSPGVGALTVHRCSKQLGLLCCYFLDLPPLDALDCLQRSNFASFFQQIRRIDGSDVRRRLSLFHSKKLYLFLALGRFNPRHQSSH